MRDDDAPRAPDEVGHIDADGPASRDGAEPDFLALDPQLEVRMRARRAGAQARRAREAQTAGAQEKALRRWGPYELIEELGEGPAAVVWRARDPVGVELAVKLLRTASVAGSEVTRRRSEALLREGAKLASVTHPSLVAVHGVAEHDGRCGLMMDVVEGRTLTERLRDDGPLSVAELIGLGVRMCDALEALHGAGLLHLGVRSRNVMLPEDGGAILMDIGSVREIADGASDREIALSGTPQFMAPELLRGQPATAAVDVYALGVTLYNAATGSFPAKGPMVRQIRHAHSQGERTLLSQQLPLWSKALTEAIDKAAALDPAERFATARDLRSALQAAATSAQRSHATHSSRLGVVWQRMPGPVRVVIGLAGVAMLVLLMWFASR